MPRPNMTGTWLGTYTFDEFEGQKPSWGPVKFTLNARQGWFGRFRGVVENEFREILNNDATIIGRVDGRQIRFVKRHPIWYVVDGGTAISLKTYLERANNIEIDREIPSEPIEYRGILDGEYRASGTWRIRKKLIRVLSQGQPADIDFPGSSGTWSMEKQNW